MGLISHLNDHQHPSSPRDSTYTSKRARDADESNMIHTPAPTLPGPHRPGHQSDFGPRFQREVPLPPRTYGAPPPVAPYGTAEHRVHPPRIPSWGNASEPGVARYQANPHPNQPSPIQNPPKSGTWRGGFDRQHSQGQMRSPSFPQVSPTSRQGGHSSHPYQTSGDLHHSSTRLQLPPFSSLPHASMQRSISHESHHSTRSIEYSRPGSSRPSSGESSGGRAEHGQAAQGPNFERRRRTRALMTRLQTSALRDLWRRTKFPGNIEREEVGSQIGLTPRQVQVWFQNQRQKARKEIDNSAIPDDAHPQDYVDLDKSPRSRRLSMEAQGAAGNSTSHGTADSITSSEQSGLSSRSMYFGYGLQTPQDEARSLATANSSKSALASQPPSAHSHYRNDGSTSVPTSSRGQHTRTASNGDRGPFAFHMASPVSSYASSPHQATFASKSAYAQRDALPSVPLPQQSPTYPTPRYGASPPQPQPMRHAATVDGELMYRRRSNSLEEVRPQPIWTSLSPPRTTQNRARTQTGPSGLPPSLASLVLARPIGSKSVQVLPRFAPDQRVPTLPPPRGWTPEQLDGHHARSHTDSIPPSTLPGASQLPGYRAMFGQGEQADSRRGGL